MIFTTVIRVALTAYPENNIQNTNLSPLVTGHSPNFERISSNTCCYRYGAYPLPYTCTSMCVSEIPRCGRSGGRRMEKRCPRTFIEVNERFHSERGKNEQKFRGLDSQTNAPNPQHPAQRVSITRSTRRRGMGSPRPAPIPTKQTKIQGENIGYCLALGRKTHTCSRGISMYLRKENHWRPRSFHFNSLLSSMGKVPNNIGNCSLHIWDRAHVLHLRLHVQWLPNGPTNINHRA